MKKKEFYEMPEFEVILFDTEDVITTSDNMLPFLPRNESSE